MQLQDVHDHPHHKTRVGYSTPLPMSNTYRLEPTLERSTAGPPLDISLIVAWEGKRRPLTLRSPVFCALRSPPEIGYRSVYIFVGTFTLSPSILLCSAFPFCPHSSDFHCPAYCCFTHVSVHVHSIPLDPCTVHTHSRIADGGGTLRVSHRIRPRLVPAHLTPTGNP